MGGGAASRTAATPAAASVLCRCPPLSYNHRCPSTTAASPACPYLPAVFFISGLALNTGDVKRALKHKLGVAFGFISTLAITPCLGFAFREIPLTPDAFTVGEEGAEEREGAKEQEGAEEQEGEEHTTQGSALWFWLRLTLCSPGLQLLSCIAVQAHLPAFLCVVARLPAHPIRKSPTLCPPCRLALQAWSSTRSCPRRLALESA